jgi:hypothetical protein
VAVTPSRTPALESGALRTWRTRLLMLASSVLPATAGAGLAVWLLWQYIPAHATAFECLHGPLPFSARLAIWASNWTVRMLPFAVVIAVAAAPGIVGGATVAAILAVQGNLQIARVLALVALLVASAGFATSAFVVYASRSAVFEAACNSQAAPEREQCRQCLAEKR